MEKTALSQAVDLAIDEVYVDKSKDAEFLSNIGEGWDDLNTLKNDMAKSVLTFVMEIESILNHQEIIDMLGEQRSEFNNLVNVFWSDIDRFSKTMQELRSQHEHRSGKLATMEELNEFTRLSMSYQTLQVEMNSLLSPTMAGIVLILHEAAPQSIQTQPVAQLNETEKCDVV